MISVIFPCYNEIENIDKNNEILRNFFNKNKDLEIIFVDNGSSDKLSEYIKNEFKEFTNVSLIIIEHNKGYGHGIYQGIKKAKYNIVAWMHADFQVSLKDLRKGCDLYIKNKNLLNEKIFVKSKRKNRNLLDNIFTFFMSLITTILFFKKINDINSTPNIINKNIFNSIKNIPNDFSFDLFCYILSINHGYKIIRYDVKYLIRKYGNSKWNFNFKSKIFLSFKMLTYIFKIRFYGLK